MVSLYEKVCKSKDNVYGMSEVKNENPFLNGPCIVTILALPLSLKDINGSLRQVASLVNPDIDNNYDPNRRILGLEVGDVDEETGKILFPTASEADLEEFASKYFYPLFLNNNEKIDVLSAMKNFRNLTFVTYCNGARTFYRMEKIINAKMKEVGFNEDDIRMIFSQVCLAAISGSVTRVRGTNALALLFGDVNDSDYISSRDLREKIKIDDARAMAIDFRPESDKEKRMMEYESVMGYAVAGDGEHSFKRHMTGDKDLSPKIAVFINTSLNNAIENKNSDIFNPITYEKIQNAFDELDEKNTPKM